MSQENVEIVRRYYEAYAEGGLDRLTEYWSDDLDHRAAKDGVDDPGDRCPEVYEPAGGCPDYDVTVGLKRQKQALDLRVKAATVVMSEAPSGTSGSE
jgi:hypothetical protein